MKWGGSGGYSVGRQEVMWLVGGVVVVGRCRANLSMQRQGGVKAGWVGKSQRHNVPRNHVPGGMSQCPPNVGRCAGEGDPNVQVQWQT